MQISAVGVEISGTNYTWQQSLWFFFLGAVWAVAASLPPVAWTLWYNYTHYSDPIDQKLIWGLIASAIGPALLGYWQQHKALLKMPPYFVIPPEFHPEIKQVEKTVQTTTPATASSPKVVETITEKHVEPMTPIRGTGDGTGTGDGK